VARAVIDVVGAGGLGVHLLESLISCLDSTCELRIFDPDVVAEENLAMQIAYTESDIGAPKALVMAKHLGLQSPRTRIRPYVERYEQRPRERTPPTLRIACVDSFASRKALNDMALADGIPLAEAGSAPWAAQQRTYLPGRTACLEHRIRNLSRKAATEKESQGCAQNPALTLPGTNMVIGGILAAESLRALQPESFGCPSDGTITYDVRAPARFGIVDSRQACEHSRVEDH
jgi:molybdopterin/thiamine biosynthesis adenylyltransferase